MATVDTSVEPLHHLISDAHRAVLGRDPYAAQTDALIDSIIARLKRAKAAAAAGDRVTASREFDPAYEVRS